MMAKRAIAIVPFMMVAMACQPKAQPESKAAPDAPAIAENSCGAEKLAAWLGKVDNSDARSAIARQSGATAIRWLLPNSPVTMDYRPDRLNAHIDAKGIYARFDCA